MKKITIMLAAAAIAVGGQAATVNWGGAIDGPAAGELHIPVRHGEFFLLAVVPDAHTVFRMIQSDDV